MPPLPIWPCVRGFLLAALISAGIVWLPLAWRYRAHRAALGALAVVSCSVTSVFLLLARINWSRRVRTVEGHWPGVIATTALGGLCDVLVPPACFAVVFWTITFASIATLEIHRAVGTHRSDKGKPSSGSDVGKATAP
jgi:hypothetical protein